MLLINALKNEREREREECFLRRWKETDNSLDQWLTHREIGGGASQTVHACPRSNSTLAKQSPTQTRSCIWPRFSLLCPTPGPWSRSLTPSRWAIKEVVYYNEFLMSRSLFGLQLRSSAAANFLWLAGHSNRIVDVWLTSTQIEPERLSQSSCTLAIVGWLLEIVFHLLVVRFPLSPVRHLFLSSPK